MSPATNLPPSLTLEHLDKRAFTLPPPTPHGVLVMVRHGESTFNKGNRFTGWTDAPLHETGMQEMRAVGARLRSRYFPHVFTSDLRRSVSAAEILIKSAGWAPPPRIEPVFSLRGRNDGDLVGLDKGEVAARFGDRNAPRWRKDFFLRLPGGESLADVAARVAPFLRNVILPALQRGDNVLAVVHGNTIRALLVALKLHTPETIESVWLPNAAVVTTTATTVFTPPKFEPANS